MRQHTTGASKNFSIFFKSLYMVYDSKFILMTSECKKISFSPSVISFARRTLAQKCLMFHDKLSSGKRETDGKKCRGIRQASSPSLAFCSRLGFAIVK